MSDIHEAIHHARHALKQATLGHRDVVPVDVGDLEKLLAGIDNYERTMKVIGELPSEPSVRWMADNPVDAIGMAVCWHHFGMAWEHAESQSKADIRKMVEGMLSAASPPSP